MLRTRLLTSLAFNLAIALWVFHDARARRARKPAFAAVLALVWGPLGLGLWMSDRPLRQGERRRVGAAAIAGGFLMGWVALLPATFVLAMCCGVQVAASMPVLLPCASAWPAKLATAAPAAPARNVRRFSSE